MEIHTVSAHVYHVVTKPTFKCSVLGAMIAHQMHYLTIYNSLPYGRVTLNPKVIYREMVHVSGKGRIKEVMLYGAAAGGMARYISECFDKE